MSTALVPFGEECPLCKDEYTIAALGPCDHRICFKCSVRLRMVCCVNECPHCRKACDQVIITRFPGTFLSLVRSVGFQKKGFLYTENDLLRDVEDLLANKCMFCKTGLVFGSFGDLQKHCNREHNLLFCDYCYENLKLFPSERKAYSSAALVEHRRHGDKDDTSYRPHPPCEFCNNQRFFDDDALYRHLKSEHFSCHLCFASTVFYSDYFELRRHFATKHYLCEEGACREARFTNAFGNELDLKGHRAAYHANLMTKEELRENAKLDLAVFSRLNLSPTTARRQQSGAGSEAGRVAGERGERISKYERRLREIQREREALYSDGSESDSNVRAPETVRLTPAEFPTLGGNVPVTSNSPPTGPMGPAASAAAVATKSNEGDIKNAAERIGLTTRTHNVGKIPVRTEEDFPALCPAGPSGGSRSSSTAWNVATAKKNVPKSASDRVNKKPSSGKQRVSSSTTNRHTEARAVVASDVFAVELPKNGKQEKPATAAITSEPEGKVDAETKKKQKKIKQEPSASEVDFPPLSSNNNGSSSPVVPVATPAVVYVQPHKKEKQKAKPEMKSEPEVSSASPVHTDGKTSVDNKKKKKANVTPPTQDLEFPPLSSNVESGSRNNAIDDEENRYYAKMDASNHGQAVKPPKVKSPPPGFAAVAATVKASPPDATTTTHETVKIQQQPIVRSVEKPNLNSAEDFPDLPQHAKPPGLVKRKAPPPGFTIIAPRPIEEQEQEPQAPAPPSAPSLPIFPFWRAADYDRRNSSLQSAIEKNLNARSSEEFRQYSKRFRESVIPAFDFISKCVDLFPRKQLGFILSELIVLLPDVKKQHALFEAVSADSLLSTLIPHLLSPCPVCGQIVTSRDAPLHRTQVHNLVPLSVDGLPTGDVDTSGLSNIDLSNYVLSGAS